jgi:hypothetical protein
MSGPQSIAASVAERLAAECHSTSFKHAHYWLMRNLLKIPRGARGVNIGVDFGGNRCGCVYISWVLAR